jgi:hypothetical protein
MNTHPLSLRHFKKMKVLFSSILASSALLTGAQAEPLEASPAKAGMPDPGRFVISEEATVQPLPLEGWSVRNPAGEKEHPSGIQVETTEVSVGGEKVPALKLTLTKGVFKKTMEPFVELPITFDADEFNVMMFRARVDVPEGLVVLGDAEVPKTGWYSYQFNRFSDNFGVAVHDGGFDWTAHGVPTTHFLNHVDRLQKCEDGFMDFQWDMRFEDRSANKGFDRKNVKSLRLYYDTTKLPEGGTVTITLIDPRLVSGTHIQFQEPELFAEWTEFIDNYEPDFSDSSEALKTPSTGRLAQPVPLARDGKALAEIIVDFSGDSAIGNFIPSEGMPLEARMGVGSEEDVLRLAGEEMKRWLDTVTGADFPYLEKPSGEKRPRIFLGAGFAKPHFAEDLEKLADDEALDGYAIRPKDGDIYIFGALPKGTLNGVYAFLENNTDLIWALPNEEFGAVYSDTPNLEAVWGDVLEKPVFVLRGWLTPEPWLRYNRGNFSHIGRNDFKSRGDFAQQGGHCLSLHGGRFGREAYGRFHPVIDGERIEEWSEYKHLMCLSHPELFDIYIAHWKESLNRPVFANTLIFNIGVDDNWGVCECTDCSAPITLEDGQTITPVDFNEFYGVWFYRFLNKVADELAEWRPGFITSTYSYFMAAPVPPIELSPNIGYTWLCPYVRKSINQPLFAPINQHWWQMMKDWHAVMPNVVHRDYYGLMLSIYPIAEVLAADLRAMRDLGVLRITTEGFATPMGDALGAAEEKWVINRLYWNPDEDVEQLRKYYLRRTFREAAPAMERFRGAIRQARYQKYSFDMDFEENHETAKMTRNLGMEAELRGYLAEALATVKHPRARVLVERTLTAFDAYMRGENIPPPPAPPKEDPAWTEFKETMKPEMAKVGAEGESAVRDYFEGLLQNSDLSLAQSAEIRQLFAGILLRAKAPQAALEQIMINLNDPRLERRARGEALRSHYPTVVLQDESITAEQAVGALSQFREVTQLEDTGRLAQQVAQSLSRRGDVEGGASVLVAENELPSRMIAEKAERQKLLRDYWRDAVRLKAPGAEEKLVLEHERLLASYREVAKNGLTHDERETANFALLQENWDDLDVAKRKEQINALIANPWIDRKLRVAAANQIPAHHTRGEEIEWSAMVDHILHAITLGDWSERHFNRDQKHALVAGTAEKLIAANEKALALKLLASGTALGYDDENGDPERRNILKELESQAKQ